MTRMCIICGKTFKLDRSAYRHVFLSHYVPDDLVRIYVIKVDQTVSVDSEGDDVEVEFIS
jgi:predicted RNA-binding protein YlxR (DUF448 family)